MIKLNTLLNREAVLFIFLNAHFLFMPNHLSIFYVLSKNNWLNMHNYGGGRGAGVRTVTSQ